MGTIKNMAKEWKYSYLHAKVLQPFSKKTHHQNHS